MSRARDSDIVGGVLGSVRAKLIAIVLLCLVPAVVAAILRAREAEDELISLEKAQLDSTDEAFLADFDEDLAAVIAALQASAADPRIVAALHGGTMLGTTAMLARLAAAYPDSVLLLSSRDGQVLFNSERAGVSTLAPETLVGLAAAFGGQAFSGVRPFPLVRGRTWCVIAAVPIVDMSTILGALVFATPLDAAYLRQVKRQLDADWSVIANGALIAQTEGHPAPNVTTLSDHVVTVVSGGERYAVNTFRPPLMQAPGQEVLVTATRRVTELQRKVRRTLIIHLSSLLGVFVIAAAVAWWMASRMSKAVAGLSHVAAEIREGKFVHVDPVRTGDELEKLAGDFNAMSDGLREREQLREAFGKYFTRQVADRIMAGKINLGGEAVPVTVLFADIRSFTTISERMNRARCWIS